jgi:hypothetical protein
MRDWQFGAIGVECYPMTRRRYDGDTVEFSPEAVRE